MNVFELFSNKISEDQWHSSEGDPWHAENDQWGEQGQWNEETIVPLTGVDESLSFNSQKECMDYFEKIGKTRAQGAAAWNSTYANKKPKDSLSKVKPFDPKKHGNQWWMKEDQMAPQAQQAAQALQKGIQVAQQKYPNLDHSFAANVIREIKPDGTIIVAGENSTSKIKQLLAQGGGANFKVVSDAELKIAQQRPISQRVGETSSDVFANGDSTSPVGGKIDEISFFQQQPKQKSKLSPEEIRHAARRMERQMKLSPEEEEHYRSPAEYYDKHDGKKDMKSIKENNKIDPNDERPPGSLYTYRQIADKERFYKHHDERRFKSIRDWVADHPEDEKEMRSKYPQAFNQGVAEGSYDDDKGITHTRGSLVAKLEALPKGSDDFEWNRIQAIHHLKQGNMLRAKYYMALMKRGEQGVAEGSLNESDKFTSWYDWKDQAKSSGYTITRKDDKIVALNKQGQVVGHWSDVGKFLSGKAPRPNFKRPVEQGVAEGSLEEVDRRGFLKGLGAAAVAGAAGYELGKDKSPTQKQIQPDRLESNPDPIYIWWYVGSLQYWLTPEGKQVYKRYKAPSIDSDDKLRQQAYRDAGMYVTRAMSTYGADKPESDQAIQKRAIKALRMLMNTDYPIKESVNQGVAEGAPELLKAEMPLVRHIERELAQHGVQKNDPEYNEKFKHVLAYYRKFGNVDAIKKDVEEGRYDDEYGLPEYDPNEADYDELRAQDRHDRRYSSELARHPNCNDPDHPGCENCEGDDDMDDDINENESGVYRAIMGRIVGAHKGLIAQYGMDNVMDAARHVANWNTDVKDLTHQNLSSLVREVFHKLTGKVDESQKKNSHGHSKKQQAAIAIAKQGVAEADKHSLVGKIQRGYELKKKVDSTFKDIGDAQKKGDKEAGSNAFRKHERYANLERPGTWTKSKEQGVAEGWDPEDDEQWSAEDPKDEMFGAGDAYKRGIQDYRKFMQTKVKPSNPYSYTKQARQSDNWEKGFEDGRYKQGVAETAAWQKSSGKNKNGGLNKKGVASYRREHPGSKLKTAVTKKPSEIKKGSKDASRRKSFCARMKGMKKHNTSSKTAHDPNSRINKSLRKWHCESIEELQQMLMIAEVTLRTAEQLDESMRDAFLNKVAPAAVNAILESKKK